MITKIFTNMRHDNKLMPRKKNIILVVFICISLGTYAQCNVASFIIDPDGYVNVRSDSNSKAEIVAKLSSGTTVYYERNNNSAWYRISLKKSDIPLGYVHSSRLLVSGDWPLRAYIENVEGKFTNICDAPEGNVILRLSAKELYTIRLSDYKNGWWKIDDINLVNYEKGGEYPLTIPSNTDYWIHTTNINSEIQGDGNCPFNLLTKPENGASVIISYPTGESPSIIENILKLSTNKLFVQIRLNDGYIGWVPISIICYNAFTTCTSCY